MQEEYLTQKISYEYVFFKRLIKKKENFKIFFIFVIDLYFVAWYIAKNLILYIEKEGIVMARQSLSPMKDFNYRENIEREKEWEEKEKMLL